MPHAGSCLTSITPLKTEKKLKSLQLVDFFLKEYILKCLLENVFCLIKKTSKHLLSIVLRQIVESFWLGPKQTCPESIQPLIALALSISVGIIL